MSDKLTLKNQTSAGIPLEATFLPEKGMNMVSFKKGDVEVIDQSTWELFNERFAGLGALIGPHFHHRKLITPIPDESLFPHIGRIKAKGIQEPFSHGIARYAPWRVEATETTIKAEISGKDTWNGVPLALLEGQEFQMIFQIALTATGLRLHLAVVSDTDSLVGLHYYYRLPDGKGKIKSFTQDYYVKDGKKEKIPSNWDYNSQRLLTLSLDKEIDFTFYPFPHPLEGHIILETSEYQLATTYACKCQENCWQLYHPLNASYVCIEPISSQDPRHPNLTTSELWIELEIL